MTPDQAERLLKLLDSIATNLGWLSLTLFLMLLFKNMGRGGRDGR